MWTLKEVKPDVDNTHVKILIEYTPETPGAIPVEWDGKLPNEDEEGRVFTKPLTPTLLEKIILYRVQEIVDEFKESEILPDDYKLSGLPSPILNQIDEKYFEVWKSLNKGKISWEDRGTQLDTSFDYTE